MICLIVVPCLQIRMRKVLLTFIPLTIVLSIPLQSSARCEHGGCVAVTREAEYFVLNMRTEIVPTLSWIANRKLSIQNNQILTLLKTTATCSNYYSAVMTLKQYYLLINSLHIQQIRCNTSIHLESCFQADISPISLF